MSGVDDRAGRAGEDAAMTRQGRQPIADAFPCMPFRIVRPNDRNSPVLVASPHSGRVYPPAFLAASRLDPHSLRRSEDCFVDELFAGAPGCGVPLLAADFPRAYCDVNREPWELDPAMFSDKLPPWCNTRTPRINAGFGTIARLVASGQPIYAEKLCFAEAEERIRSCWQPYHDALSGLIAETRDGFSHCILLDCHSMPTEEPASGSRHDPDFVLGDAHGTSCDPVLSDAAHRFLEQAGYRVRRNDPYAGGYVTRHYGRPRHSVHALQIEVSRSLYLDQTRYLKLPRFDGLRELMSGLLRALSGAMTQPA